MQKFLNFDVDDSEMNDGELSEFEQFIENMSDEGYRHVYVNIAADQDPTLNLGRKDPIELQINMKSIIGEYKSCKPLKSGSLLVEVNDFNQVRKLLLVKEFMNIKVQTKIANEIGSSKGTIYEPRIINRTPEELCNIWKHYGVINVEKHT